jgi:carboxymethylenebutenolidase
VFRSRQRAADPTALGRVGRGSIAGAPLGRWDRLSGIPRPAVEPHRKGDHHPVRGLHHYYEELAQRFAEMGVEAVAIDYFGRTAGVDARGDEFDFGPHVAATTWDGISADFVAAADYLRSESSAAALFSIGFCMGGRNAFLSATIDQRLAGAIGFYGFPSGAGNNGSPAPVDRIDRFGCPVLGIFGGADQAIPVATVQQFRDALQAAGIEQEIVVEPDAPHSFFDRKAAEYQAQSDDAWARVRRFIEDHGAN